MTVIDEPAFEDRRSRRAKISPRADFEPAESLKEMTKETNEQIKEDSDFLKRAFETEKKIRERLEKKRPMREDSELVKEKLSLAREAGGFVRQGASKAAIEVMPKMMGRLDQAAARGAVRGSPLEGVKCGGADVRKEKITRKPIKRRVDSQDDCR